MTALGDDVYVGTLNYESLNPPVNVSVAEKIINPNAEVVIDAINGSAGLEQLEANSVMVNEALTYQQNIFNQDSGDIEIKNVRNGCIYSNVAGGTLKLPVSERGYHCWFVCGFASGNISLIPQSGETINGITAFNLQSSKKVHKLIGVGGGLWFID